MLDNKDLDVFVAIAETGSFTLAGQRVHLTQSAVSKRLGHLEQQLGLSLIHRQERPWRLTAAGRRLLPEARQMLAGLAEIERRVRDQEPEPMGTLRMAITHHLSLYRLPAIIKRFKKRHPAVELELAFSTSAEVHHDIAQKRFELGFCALKASEPPRMHYRSLWNDALVFVADRGEPWARRTVGFADLCERPAVLPKPSNLYFQMVNQLFLHAGFGIRQLFAAEYLETVRSMVSAGLGWSVLPAAMLDRRLVELRLEQPGPLSRTLGAVYRQGSPLSAAASAFLDMAADAAGGVDQA